jgi:hypothetical protein
VRKGSRAGALLLGLLLASCEGRPLEVGKSVVGGLGLNGDTSLSPLEQRCLDLAAPRALDAECWPTAHVGRWHGFVTGDARYLHVLSSPFPYPSGELLLEVDAQGSASLTFSGGPDAGTDDADDAGAGHAAAPCSSTSAPDSCQALPGLVLGFRYQPVGLRMTGSPSEDRHQDPRMDFSLTLAEPWRRRCDAVAADAGACACTAQGCGVSPESLQVTLLLSADGQALRGSARSEHATETIAAGWEFVRE